MSTSQDIEPYESISQVGWGKQLHSSSATTSQAAAPQTSSGSGFLGQARAKSIVNEEKYLIIQNDPLTLTRANSILGRVYYPFKYCH